MNPWFWGGVLAVAAWAAHWGAERLARPLELLRRRQGISAAAGGALVGLAAASPEVGINVASAVRGVADIGLGAALAANVIAIPLVVAVAYMASRRIEDEEADPEHDEHLEQGLLRVERQGVRVQAFPYLGLVALFAVLTLPPGWRGLQPVDGLLLAAGYAVFLAQALLRGRAEGEYESWDRGEVLRALAGLIVLAVAAWFIVRATENLVEAFGISGVVGGMFITAPMAALPELFATWSVMRSGQVTSATTSVIGDHAVTLTLAFVPLAVIGLPVENVLLFAVNLGFVAGMGAAFAGLAHWGEGEHGFRVGQVVGLVGLLVAYVLTLVVWVLPRS
ncbi:MAG: hypothetical protein RJQ04_07105 [Longimicrobiales bacterium]